jgi:hypothetical protein
MLGFMCGIVVGDWPIASGWIVRVQHLLGVAVDSPKGWVARPLGCLSDDSRKLLRSPVRLNDNNLRSRRLAYLGASLVHADRCTKSCRHVLPCA